MWVSGILLFSMEVEKKEGRFGVGVVRLAIIVALVAGVSFLGGISVGAEGKKLLADVPLLNNGLDPTPDPSADLSEFWKAWNVLKTRFVESSASSTPPETKEKLWGAIDGLAESYGDPYTLFLRPEDAKLFAEDIAGNFSGVGMEIGLNKEGVLTVISPLKGTPAEKAGILSGDQIIAIDGVSTEGYSTEAAVKKIRGEKGVPVVFRIIRDGEPLEISVVRDTIQIPIIEGEYNREAGVYVISFYSFSANSGSLFSKALAAFRESGAKRLLIDLRGNPGGFLASAVGVASHFLPEGTVIVTEDYDGNRGDVSHRSKGAGGVPKGTRIAILVDQGSASASEIVAGALQDEGVETLIGKKTFCQLSVQELVDVGGGSLKITVARWLTPNGRSISAGGLSPDIEVEYTLEDREAGKDPQKERAIQYLQTGK